jgi:hypothetical protein
MVFFIVLLRLPHVIQFRQFPVSYPFHFFLLSILPFSSIHPCTPSNFPFPSLPIPPSIPPHLFSSLLFSPAGYHRVWSIDQQCLGEMALPNLLEKMKNTMGQVTLKHIALPCFLIFVLTSIV